MKSHLDEISERMKNCLRCNKDAMHFLKEDKFQLVATNLMLETGNDFLNGARYNAKALNKGLDRYHEDLTNAHAEAYKLFEDAENGKLDAKEIAARKESIMEKIRALKVHSEYP